MKLYTNGNHIRVVLSKRNLLALLHKLEMPHSARTICKSTDDGFLEVRVEDDSTHYGEDLPGIMHPETEAFIENHK